MMMMKYSHKLTFPHKQDISPQPVIEQHVSDAELDIDIDTVSVTRNDDEIESVPVKRLSTKRKRWTPEDDGSLASAR